MTPTEISTLVTQITDDVKLIVADEIALAKAEIRPMAKKVGIGAGMFSGALWFVISATIILWFVIAAGFTWLYGATTSLSPYAAVFLGTVTCFVLVLVIAGILAALGIVSFKGIRGFEKTPATVSEAFGAITQGITTGAEAVHEELKQAADAREQAKGLKDDVRAAKATARATRRNGWSSSE